MERSVVLKLLALMLAPLSFSTGAFVFGGVLAPMAGDLGVSIAAAGQLQAAFALSCAAAGPFLARYTGRFERRRVLLAVLAAMVLFNALSAVAGGYGLLFAARVATGIAGALTIPVSSAIAVGLAPPEKRPQALAMVYAGIALALLIGIPLGTFVGGAYGWPACFWLASAMCGVGFSAALFALPKTPPPPAPPEGAFRRALQGGTPRLYLATFAGFAATFASVSFVGPVTTAITGLEGASIGAVQIFVGIGSLIGLFFGARIAARVGAPAIPALLAIMALTQALISVGMRIEAGFAANFVLAVGAFGVGAGALFALSTVVQNALSERAGPAATVAFALNGSMVYFGQGGGALIGGLTTSGIALASVGYAGATIGVVAATGVFLAQRRVSDQLESSA
ncbi:MAG: MFS transporter [Pseudomonadota bacterium]